MFETRVRRRSKTIARYILNAMLKDSKFDAHGLNCTSNPTLDVLFPFIAIISLKIERLILWYQLC